MKFLGIKIGDHDANFAFSDGTTVFYHKSERNQQIKHHGSTDPLIWIPILKSWGYEPSDIDAICVTSDEELYRETVDPTVHYHQIKTENWFPGLTCPTYRLDHHLAHALSVWPITNLEPTVSFVFDGDGDFGRSFSVFKGLELIESKTVREVTSFGRVLENLAEQFDIQGQRLDVSGKLMGLKSYGTVNQQYKNLISIFSLTDIDQVTDITFWETITQTDFATSKLDYLATIHDFAETKFPELFSKYAAADDVISFVGGVAQNSVINAKIQKDFPNCVIPPHGADDGLSLGCIELLRKLYHQPTFNTAGFPFWQNDPVVESPTIDTIIQVSKLLAAGKIVGWHQGQGEIGPRALGNRSILMDPRIAQGKDIINAKVKHRELFRPFGASVLEEHAAEYFDIKYPSPYMLHVVDVISTDLPAVTHIDGTSRVQTVNQSNLYYYNVLKEFYKLTGCAVLLNTSLNNNGKPIASTEQDSMNFFKSSQLDAICIGNRIYKK
jgi:carbamoyltransferase